MLLTLFNTFKENSQSHTRRLHSYQSNIYYVFFSKIVFTIFLLVLLFLNMGLDTSIAKAIYIGLHVAESTLGELIPSYGDFSSLFLRDLLSFQILCSYLVCNRYYERCHKHIPANTLEKHFPSSCMDLAWQL